MDWLFGGDELASILWTGRLASLVVAVTFVSVLITCGMAAYFNWRGLRNAILAMLIADAVVGIGVVLTARVAREEATRLREVIATGEASAAWNGLRNVIIVYGPGPEVYIGGIRVRSEIQEIAAIPAGRIGDVNTLLAREGLAFAMDEPGLQTDLSAARTE